MTRQSNARGEPLRDQPVEEIGCHLTVPAPDEGVVLALETIPAVECHCDYEFGLAPWQANRRQHLDALLKRDGARSAHSRWIIIAQHLTSLRNKRALNQ